MLGKRKAASAPVARQPKRGKQDQVVERSQRRSAKAVEQKEEQEQEQEQGQEEEVAKVAHWESDEEEHDDGAAEPDDQAASDSTQEIEEEVDVVGRVLGRQSLGESTKHNTTTQQHTHARTKHKTERGSVRLRPAFHCAGKLTRNEARASLEEMFRVQQVQLRAFRRCARNNRWDEIHHDHYDWFMFPIEDSSRRQYNVLRDDVRELKADASWMSGYRDGITLVAKAWGWDVAKHSPVRDKHPRMRWTHWDVRLAKMIRSLWLFGEKDMMKSLQAFARSVKPNGGFYYAGVCLDEILLMS